MSPDTMDMLNDRMIVEKSGMQDVNPETLNRYRNLLRSITPTHPWLNDPEEEFLRHLGAAETEAGGFRLTMAGLLMFGNDYRITRAIPEYYLDYRRYEAGEGWVDRLNSDSGLWSGNLFDFYVGISDRLTDFNNHSAFEGTQRFGNQVIKAQKEIILNALAHADYRGAGGIVLNPGWTV